MVVAMQECVVMVLAMKIQVSASSKELLAQNGGFKMTYRGLTHVKVKLKFTTIFLSNYCTISFYVMT